MKIKKKGQNQEYTIVVYGLQNETTNPFGNKPNHDTFASPTYFVFHLYIAPGRESRKFYYFCFFFHVDVAIDIQATYFHDNC